MDNPYKPPETSSKPTAANKSARKTSAGVLAFLYGAGVLTVGGLSKQRGRSWGNDFDCGRDWSSSDGRDADDSAWTA